MGEQAWVGSEMLILFPDSVLSLFPPQIAHSMQHVAFKNQKKKRDRESWPARSDD